MIAFLAGLGRAVVGAGWFQRAVIYPIVAGSCAYLGFGLEWWAIPFAVVPAATLWVGYTRWEDAYYMGLRYGLPPLALAIVHAAISGVAADQVIWALVCALVGLTYGTGLRLLRDVRVVAWGRQILDANRLVEMVAGTVIIGGVSLL